MQIEHKTEKGTLCFILPNKEVIGFTYVVRNALWYRKENGFSYIKLSSDGFKLIGLTSEITQEHCDNMLPGISTAQLDGVYYSIGDGERYCHENSLSAFKSLMQYLQVYEVNPYPKFYVNKITGKESVRIDWEQTQSRTGRWLVLFKPND